MLEGSKAVLCYAAGTETENRPSSSRKTVNSKPCLTNVKLSTLYHWCLSLGLSGYKLYIKTISSILG
jgi:hypothetical protein